MTTTALALRSPRLIPFLTLLAGTMVAVYVALMVTTILFAALQTDLAHKVQEKRMDIAKLERTYYSAIASLDSTDPGSQGFVTPQRVTYVAEAAAQNLTLAR